MTRHHAHLRNDLVMTLGSVAVALGALSIAGLFCLLGGVS